MIGDTAAGVSMRLTAAALLIAGLAGISSCSDPVAVDPGQKGLAPGDPGPAGLIVSDPLTGAATGPTAGLASVVSSVAYVSLVPGTFPNGVAGKISNRRTAVALTVALVAGGLDPVAIAAEAGDTLDFAIDTGGVEQVRFARTVPAFLKVGVVRTDPPAGKRDVPLNLRVGVIFTEPVDTTSVTRVTLGLKQGETSVSGQVSVSPDGLEATFQPAGALLPETAYTITVGDGIRDLEGSQLSSPVTAGFTTGTASGLAVALSFDRQPVNTLVSSLMPPTVIAVTARDASGNLATGFTGSITLTIGANPGGGSLTGTTTRAGPYANFDDLRIDRVGSGYTLVATAPGLRSATSAAFGIASATDVIAFGKPGRGICLVDAAGSGVGCLVGGRDPAWSPDGKKIAFVGSFDGLEGIHIMNADGSGEVELTTGGGGTRSPAWSPDGAKIAFVCCQNPNAAIYVMNVDGSGLTRLSMLSASRWDEAPAWSPDGTKIAYTDVFIGQLQNIYVMNADGSGVTQLTSDVSAEPAWSPDGTKIAFAGGGSIYVMHADGSGITRLTRGIVDEHPTWSPDGTRIAFLSTAVPNPDFLGFYTLTIYLMNADGSGRSELIPEGTTFLGSPAWRPRVGP